MTDISICVSQKSRFRPLSQVIAGLAGINLDIELVIADYDDIQWEMPDNVRLKIVSMSGPYSRGRSLNAAIAAATGDVLMITDADVKISEEAIRRGLGSVASGKAAFPVMMLEHPNGTIDQPYEASYGICFIHRSDVAKYPEFYSWGGEDVAFMYSIQVEIDRYVDQGLRHIWHSVEDRNTNYLRKEHADAHGFNSVVDELSRLDEFYFVVPVGNRGDSLIRQSAIELFDSHGFKYQEVDGGHVDLIPPHSNVVINGGGAWCEPWPHGYQIALSCRSPKSLVVLPSTYQSADFLVGLPEHTVLFTRENHSFELAKQRHTTYLTRDLAERLTPVGFNRELPLLNAFRSKDDPEAGSIAIPPDNFDVSATGWHNSDPYEFMQIISRYERIHTDRLHVAIVGMMHGCDVHLYSSAYGKQRWYWETWLHQHVHWVDIHETDERFAVIRKIESEIENRARR
jgi:hypothetical protein